VTLRCADRRSLRLVSSANQRSTSLTEVDFGVATGQRFEFPTVRLRSRW
jgi:hypothetical protein